MTTVYSTQVTSWFIAAQQAFAAGGAAVNLAGGTVKVGDGAGVVPTISALLANGGVLHQVWSGPVNSVAVDASNAAQIDVGVLIPTVDSSGAEIGPFNVTEFAIYEAGGNLCIVGNTNLQKTTSAMGQPMSLQWYACYVESVANSVTVTPPPGSYPTLGQLQGWIAGLLSATSPIALTAALQGSGWTDWSVSVQFASQPAGTSSAQEKAAVGVTRAATAAEFAAGAAESGAEIAFPYPTLQQVTGALGALPGEIAGLLSGVSPIVVTPSLQSSGWTDWTVGIAPGAFIIEGTDTGTANVLAVSTTSPAESTLIAGQLLLITKGAAANTGAVTGTVDTETGVFVWADGTALIANDWPATVPALVVWTGTQFRILSIVGPSIFSRKTPTRIVTVTSTQTLTFAANETRCRIRGNGPGAGGGGSYGSAGAGAGGGAGAYIDAYVTGQAAANTLAFTVGAPGAAGSGTPTNGGTAGTTTIVGTGVSITFNPAVGGSAGNTAVGAAAANGGYLTTSGANLQVLEALSGGSGGSGFQVTSSMVSGVGGASPRSGSTAGPNVGTAGSAGSVPGAGGNGGTIGYNGGNGASASLVVEFYP